MVCGVSKLCEALLESAAAIVAPFCWPFRRSRAEVLGDFPPAEKIWEGGEFKFLGSDIKYKRIVFVDVQVTVMLRILSHSLPPDLFGMVTRDGILSLHLDRIPYPSQMQGMSSSYSCMQGCVCSIKVSGRDSFTTVNQRHCDSKQDACM